MTALIILFALAMVICVIYGAGNDIPKKEKVSNFEEEEEHFLINKNKAGYKN